MTTKRCCKLKKSTTSLLIHSLFLLLLLFCKDSVVNRQHQQSHFNSIIDVVSATKSSCNHHHYNKFPSVRTITSTTITAAHRQQRRPLVQVAFGGYFFGSVTKVPTSTQERDNQAITSIKAAIASPRTPSFPLIECEFPPIQSLNKLGDGSLRSSIDVDNINIDFCTKLIQSLASPIPWGGSPIVWLLTSSAATTSFYQKACNKLNKNNNVIVHSMKNGILPPFKSRDICVFVSPCVSNDYVSAEKLAMNGISIVLVNGYSKDTRSVSGDATMAYYLRPLTYNSQIGGYLIRSYPGPWTVLDASLSGQRNKILQTFTDTSILVSNTNTPDLRQSVKIVQKAVDEKAILARQNRK